MISKSVALGLFAAGCMTAAGGGAYVAVRQNDVAGAERAAIQPAPVPAPAATPVSETEAVVAPAAPQAPARRVAEPQVETPRDKTAKAVARKSEPSRVERGRVASSPRPSASTPVHAPATRPADATADPGVSPVGNPATGNDRPSATREPAGNTTPSAPPAAEPVVPEPAPAPSKPELIEVIVPASSVVGLRVDTTLSSENARVEDRVEARVMRDVLSDGRVAIPAGTRVLGDVVLVDRGGKIKDKARLGVRFHTLVLANGSQVPFRTDAIYREGTSPGTESARKIGGAAVGGAILGAIIGGAKGAAIGGATGAAGGSAVVMAGDRNAATLPAGTTVTVRLNAPVSVDIEREF
jgi:hypothetical protein